MSSENTSETFLKIIEAHKGILFKIANIYCKDAEARKDLIQEIVLQLWRSFSQYDDQYKLSTWIYRIALNVSITFYKKEKRRSAISNPLEVSVIRFTEDEDTTAPNPDLELLQRCISELKEFDKALIILHLEGHDHLEISQILGITTTNVSTKISRIKKRLKHKFQLLKAKHYERYGNG